MKRSALGIILLFALSTFGTGRMQADEPAIITAIEQGGVVVIDQPAALKKRLSGGSSTVSKPDASTPTTATPSASSSSENETELPAVTGTTKSAGYRVQVFADNNARTAKAEARAKAQALQQRLPYPTYVVYQSPYWRLKVGDFPTETEAKNAADEIRKLFPAYAREVVVVKDRINR